MSGQILLVEDSDADAELGIVALRRARIANPVVRVRDGAEALDYLSARGAFGSRDFNDLPAVVLLDLRMPRVDGFEALKEIRADQGLRSLPVVILTCSDEERCRLGAYDDAATSIACKPIDRDQLVAATAKLGLGWLTPAC